MQVSIGQGGAQPDGTSASPSISQDGRFVAFSSAASNLVANDTNGQADVFVRDRQANTTTRVSVATGGGQGTGPSSSPRISANGRFVVFDSFAALVPDDTNGDSCPNNSPCTDVYVHDRDTATTSRVSIATGGAQANNASGGASISGDGRYVVFASSASNLVADDTNGVPDTFLHDRLSGSTTRVSLFPDNTQLEQGSFARISSDGSIIVFGALVRAADWPAIPACAETTNLFCSATFVLNRETGVRTLLSTSLPSVGPTTGSVFEGIQSLSRDGRFVVIAQTINFQRPAFFFTRDVMLDRMTMRVTLTAWRDFAYSPRNGPLSAFLAMSDDGRVSAFYREPVVGLMPTTTTLVDRNNGAEEVLTPRDLTEPTLDADGRTVAFKSSSNLDGVDIALGRIWVIDRDTDDDRLTDAWETQFGFDVNNAGDAALDADGDGSTNLEEYDRGTHPKTAATRYFAEGAANAFFSTRLATLNPNATAATVVYRFLGTNGETSSVTRTLPPESRTTLDLLNYGLAPANDFSTVVESSQPLVVDRTMTWDSTGYGTHAETSLAAPSTTWYLAEGATHGAFDLFYLIQNPGDATASVQITYMRLAPNPPIVKTYDVAPRSRRTIPVDGEGPGLEATDVAASITSTQPIVVERAMYASAPEQAFRAGHGGAGVTAPATQWYLAEGATGTFFDTYVLVANPATAAAQIKVTYLLPDGVTFSGTHTVGPQNRLTLTVADQDPRLADTPVSVIVESTNAQPVVVERTMWWPKGQWYEAHAVAGATQTGTRWALADGEVGADYTYGMPRPTDTYILIANTSATDGSATVKLFLEGGGTMEHVVPLKANSRVNFPTTGLFEVNASKRFSAIVESNGVPIVVERAMYSSANGLTWTAGTASLATRLQ